MAPVSHSMDGSSGSGSSRGSSRTNSSSTNMPLGVNKQSTKINKSLKRTTSTQLHHPQHSTTKQPPPPPVYNINKNDFRNLVQQLTGSPLTERYDQQPSPPLPPPSLPPPPSAKPPNSRLHKIRPPPLNALNTVIGPSSQIRSPAFSVSPFSVSPLPPLTPGDAVWAGHMAVESPVTQYMKYLQDSMTPGGLSRNPSPRGFGPFPGGSYPHRPPPHYAVAPPHRPPPPLPSPTSQFLLPSPLPSPGSFFSLPSPGSYFAQSPSAHYGPLLSPLPQSPGVMFPLPSPTGRFPSPGLRWREPSHSDLSNEDFSFPDPDRRL